MGVEEGVTWSRQVAGEEVQGVLGGEWSSRGGPRHLVCFPRGPRLSTLSGQCSGDFNRFAGGSWGGGRSIGPGFGPALLTRDFHRFRKPFLQCMLRGLFLLFPLDFLFSVRVQRKHA